MIAENCWALVPLKDMLKAKQRLQGILSLSERRDLFLAMVKDLLGTLSGENLFGNHVLVVSDDPTAALLAESYGLTCIQEEIPEAGLNRAIETGISWTKNHQIETVMVIHGDLPLIQSHEVKSLLTRHMQTKSRPRISLVSDRAGNGTNCLLLTPPDALAPCFGQDSRRRHINSAEEKGVAIEVMDLPSLQFDVDEPVDLRELSRMLNQGEGKLLAPHTFEVLVQDAISGRIRAMDLEGTELRAEKRWGTTE